MPVALVRKPSSIDVHDADATRAALKEALALEVTLKGQPIPRLVFLADGYEESLDLTSALHDDAEAHMGATFQLLRQRPEVERAFVVLRLEAVDKAGNHFSFALLFEEIAAFDEPRRWWTTLHEFRADPVTALGHLNGTWQDAEEETPDLEALLPALREFAAPPPGSRAARVLPARTPQPDIKVAMGELPPGFPAPTNAVGMAELAGQVALGDLLSGAAQGTLVVRYAQRAWEVWVLGDNQPADLEDMIRYIANTHQPPAEGVAVLMVAIAPEDTPPVPAVQLIAELGGAFVETRAPIDFSEGPSGPKRLRETRMRGPRPVPEGGMWLGVDPMVNFDLGPMVVGEG